MGYLLIFAYNLNICFGIAIFVDKVLYSLLLLLLFAKVNHLNFEKKIKILLRNKILNLFPLKF